VDNFLKMIRLKPWKKFHPRLRRKSEREFLVLVIATEKLVNKIGSTARLE